MSVNAKLRKIAAALPPVPDPAKQGMAARRAGKGSHIKGPGRYRGKATYTKPLPFVGVDHFKELRRAWDTGGMEAVTAYVNSIPARVPNRLADKITRRIPFRTRLALLLAALIQWIKNLVNDRN